MDDELAPDPEFGQVWTPVPSADSMISIISRQGLGPIRKVLDPAVGPFTFPAAFLRSGFAKTNDLVFDMFDLDERMVGYCKKRVKQEGRTHWRVHQADYLKTVVGSKYDCVIMNPPYIRQEDLPRGEKEAYAKLLELYYGVRIDRRSNVFALFLLKGMMDLRDGGVLCAIVYDAIANTKYGKKTMELLESRGTLLHSEHVESPFETAMIDARIMCWRKCETKEVELISQEASTANGLVAMEKLLSIRRGTSIPNRRLYVLKEKDPIALNHVPVLIKQHDCDNFRCTELDNVIDVEDNEHDRDCLLSRAIRMGLDSLPKKLTLHKVTGSLCFNYYIRSRPRHLVNVEGVYVSDNYYVSDVIGAFPVKAAWVLLNSELFIRRILDAGRPQGDGLTKLQCYEYKQALVPDWRILPARQIRRLLATADRLLSIKSDYFTVVNEATKIAKEVFNAQS